MTLSTLDSQSHEMFVWTTGLLIARFDGMAGSGDCTNAHWTKEAGDIYIQATCSNSQLVAVEAVQAYLMT